MPIQNFVNTDLVIFAFFECLLWILCNIRYEMKKYYFYIIIIILIVMSPSPPKND